MDSNWLTLSEYSTKYKVSISTLRRRLKAGSADFVLKEGKYWLKDVPLTKTTINVNNPSPPKKDVVPPHHSSSKVKSVEGKKSQQKKQSMPVDNSSAVVATIKGMADEVKKAYRQILQEKEEQILSLKSQVSDIKTLVKVLESENTRLKKQNEKQRESQKENLSTESWLELEN